MTVKRDAHDKAEKLAAAVELLAAAESRLDQRSAEPEPNSVRPVTRHLLPQHQRCALCQIRTNAANPDLQLPDDQLATLLAVVSPPRPPATLSSARAPRGK